MNTLLQRRAIRVHSALAVALLGACGGGGGGGGASVPAGPSPLLATQVTTSSGHACALLDTGRVKCWGNNGSGALGLGDTDTRGDQAGEMGNILPAIDLGAGRTATQIAAGSNGYTCALLDTGQVKCWGFNGNGELGLGDFLSRGDEPSEMGDNLLAVNLGNDDNNIQLKAIRVASGSIHTCALFESGNVKCWGANNFGQLGLGDTSRRGGDPGDMGDNLPTIDLGTGRTATQIAPANFLNGFHTCALLDTGQVKCWGRNQAGQLGLGDIDTRGDQAGEMSILPTVDLGLGLTATQIATGSNHSCALLDTGQVKCWGLNEGQLGLGDGLNRGDGLDALGNSEMGDNLPAVDLGNNPPGSGTKLTVTQIVAGSFHTCALLDTGQVKCWGSNSRGQLGLGDTNRRGFTAGQMGDNLPTVDLGIGRSATQIAAGDSYACALLDTGQVKCWGNNREGQLGLGDLIDRGDQAGEMGDALPVVDLGTR